MDKLSLTLATWFWVSSNSKLLCLWQKNGNWGRSGIPELENGVKKPSYRLWPHKTELSQIVKS